MGKQGVARKYQVKKVKTRKRTRKGKGNNQYYNPDNYVHAYSFLLPCSSLDKILIFIEQFIVL